MNPSMMFQATILFCFGPVLFSASAFGQEISWHASGKNGAVRAGHADSVAAGIKVLEQGGRAADAAAATILALSVKVLSGIGGAPSDPAAIEWFYKNGIPANGRMQVGGTAACQQTI